MWEVCSNIEGIMRKYFSMAGLLTAVIGLVLIVSYALMRVLLPAAAEGGGVIGVGLIPGVILLALGGVVIAAGRQR